MKTRDRDAKSGIFDELVLMKAPGHVECDVTSDLNDILRWLELGVISSDKGKLLAESIGDPSKSREEELKVFIKNQTGGSFKYNVMGKIFSNTKTAAGTLIVGGSDKPVCVVGSFADEGTELQEAIVIASGYCKTLLGYHADIASITFVLFSSSHAYCGIVGWSRHSHLKGLIYDNGVDLTIETPSLNRRRSSQGCGGTSWDTLYSLLFHPAQTRCTEFRLQWYSQPADTETFKISIARCLAVGSSAAAYLAECDDYPDGLVVAKFFQEDLAFDREHHILSGLQKIKPDFGPKILGSNRDLRCLVYERLSPSEHSSLYNDQVARLNASHFPELLHQALFMHSQGVVHQDIRPVIVAFRNGKPLFIDFAFASLFAWSPLNDRSIPRKYCPIGYFGTRETASNRILAILADDPDADVDVTPKDDLISLYKTLIMTCSGGDFHIGASTWGDFKLAWHVDPQVRRFERMSYEKLVRDLTQTNL